MLSSFVHRSDASGPVVLSSGGAADRGDRPGPSPAERSDEGLARLRVVIVEDEAIISLELEDMLEALGCEVVGTARNAEEAMRAAERERPDFLTMDVSLPGDRDGIAVAMEIYERLQLRSLFISAFGDAETLGRAQAARPLGWLAKPLRHRRLAEALELVRSRLRES